jgi:phosphonate ABC transporter substrate-binding protein
VAVSEQLLRRSGDGRPYDGRSVLLRTGAGPLGLVAIAVIVLLESATVSAQADTAAVWILVVKEHGVGSPTLVQPHLDRFVAIAAEQNGWADAKGQYYNARSAAEPFIQAHHPHYGIFSLPVFLALRAKHGLDVLGQVAVSLAGERQYYLISKSAADLAGCKGKTMVSDHTDDPRFIERVVARGEFTLADFTVVKTQRPLQTITKVINDEAVCALIDDAQLAELPHLEGAAGLRTVWKSAELPPMVVAAFPAAPADERKRFQEHLVDLCDKDGQSACAEVGIVSLKAARATDYAAVVAAYGK